MKKFIPYLLPIISIIGIVAVLFFDPNITGFAVVDDTIKSNVQLVLKEGIVMPKTAVIEVRLNDEYGILTVDEFIKRTGEEYRYEDGEYKLIGYKGKGYTGDYVYELTLEDFGIAEVSRDKEHNLSIKVSYNGKMIVEGSGIVNSK